jgi:hypothetical protein
MKTASTGMDRIKGIAYLFISVKWFFTPVFLC